MMLSIDEQIEVLEKEIKDINYQRKKLEDDIYYLNKRKTYVKKALLEAKKKKDGEDGETHRSALQCESDL